MKKLNPAIYSKNNEYTTKESLFQEGEDGLNIRKSVDSCVMTSLVAETAKNLCLQCRRSRFDPWVGESPWRKKWQSTPVFLPGEFHGQRTLAGYSPRGHKELDTTE